VTGTNCFHIQGDFEGNGKYFTNWRNDAAVQNVNGEVRELIRYDSSNSITQAPVF